MSTIITSALADNSTLSNYKAWSQSISNALSTFGWTQTTDIGQVDWSSITSSQLPLNTIQTPNFCSLNITNATKSSTNVVFTYTNLSGTILAANQVITISGYTGGDAANNGTFFIGSIGSGTFTVPNSSGVSSTSTTASAIVGVSAWTSGTNYAIGCVVTNSSNTYMCITSSGSGTNAPPNTTYWCPFNYEMWQSGDDLTTYYVRIEYATQNVNAGSANAQPCLFITMGISTSGIGGIPGITTIPNGATVRTKVSGDAITSSTGYAAQTAYWRPCFLSGASDHFSIFMFSNPQLPTLSPYIYGQFSFAVERDHNSSGVNQNTGMTLIQVSTQGTTSSSRTIQYVGFTYGASTQETSFLLCGFYSSTITYTNGTTNSSNSSSTGAGSLGTKAYPVFSNSGFLNRLFSVMVLQNYNATGSQYNWGDATEGAFVNVEIYGTIHTYVVMGGEAAFLAAGSGTTCILLVRFE